MNFNEVLFAKALLFLLEREKGRTAGSETKKPRSSSENSVKWD
jgi:hypothetical protein